MTDFHVTQDVVEALTTSAPDLRVTQHVVEALSTLPIGAQVTQAVWELLTPAVDTPPTTGQGHVKTNQGNKHTRTDENGSVKVVAVTAGSLTGPLTPFANVQVATDDTGAIKFAPITLNPPLGPLTDLANLRVCTDENEALFVATQTAGSTVGPLTNLGNLRARTDARGALIVASVAAGSLQTPLTPTLNLRGRTDENGALIVTGLSTGPAIVNSIGSPGANASGVTTIAANAFANTAGNRLVAFVRYNTAAKLITTITDTSGNAWSFLADVGSLSGHLEAWMTTAITAHAANIVTATLSSASPYTAIIVVQVSGVSGSDIVAVGGPTNAPTVTTAAFTTTVATELILAGNDVAELNTPVWAPNAGFTILREDPTHIMMVQSSSVTTIQTAKTVSATQTTDVSNPKTIIAVSLK